MRADIHRRGYVASMLGPGAAYNSSHSHALGGSGSEGAGADTRGGGRAAYGNYSLLIVGHSLGAGVAFLLALLLKPAYPTLKCYGYGTPGSLVDSNLAQSSEGWMTSVVLDDDLIARLGVGSLNHLRDQVLDCIVRAKVNKTSIMQSLFRTVTSQSIVTGNNIHNTTTNTGAGDDNAGNTMNGIGDYLYAPDAVPPSRFKDNVDTFRRLMKQRNATELSALDGGTEGENLTIPGNIIHLVRPGGSSDIAISSPTPASSGGSRNRGRGVSSLSTAGSTTSATGGCCSGRNAYIPQEVGSEAFAELIISGNMALDHFPDRYVDELRVLVGAWEPDSDHIDH